MSGTSTIRDYVTDAQDQMLHDLPPAQARVLLVKLTSLIGNALHECVQADHAFNVVLLKFLDSDEAAARARIRAETSLEFVRRQEARNTQTVLIEAVRSLKTYLKSTDEEMRLSR